MLSEIKGLALRSAIYGTGDILLRVVNFLLLPIYTRLLTPADYGILAVTGLISVILAIFMSLSLHGFVSPLYFSVHSDQERRENIGTLFVFVIFIGGVIALLADRFLGPFFSSIIRSVPFDPYIRLAIWTTYFSVWGRIPLSLLQIQERSGIYVLFTLSSSLLQIGLALWFVVYLQHGINGLLTGYFLASLIMSVVHLILVLRNLKPSFKLDILKQALIFSIPLVPHELSGWILELSDRAILQWYVSLDQVGIYSLAYSYGSLINLIAYAINIAWVPFLYRTDSVEREKTSVRFGQMGTYFVLILCLSGLFLGLAAQPVISVITAPSYHKSGEIAPWIVAALLLSGLYYFPINFLFLRRKTAIVSQVTIISSITNIILNLLLIPVYGAIAAAWTTFLSYGIMLLLAWRFAFKVYPVVYEYRRLIILASTTVLLWVIGNILPWTSFWLEVIGKSTLLILFPIILERLGFFTEAEKIYITNQWNWIIRKLRGGMT